MKWIRGLIDATMMKIHLRLGERFQDCADKHIAWHKRRKKK